MTRAVVVGLLSVLLLAGAAPAQAGPLGTPVGPLVVADVAPADRSAAPSTAPSTAPSPAQRGRLRVRAALRRLPVAREQRTGYDRDAFTHWVDDDGDCQDTRVEVLVAEARTPVTGCRVDSGSWLSYYDRVTHTVASDLDIDHLVPLAEAWDSGAGRWDGDTRRRFANDLGDARSLVAVTAGVNRSKSDRDPAEWLPDHGRCRYVREWVAVKTRWSLTVDRPEKRALTRQARACPNRWVRVSRARVVVVPAS